MGLFRDVFSKPVFSSSLFSSAWNFFDFLGDDAFKYSLYFYDSPFGSEKFFTQDCHLAIDISRVGKSMSPLAGAISRRFPQ